MKQEYSKTISKIAAVLVFMLALSAFILSFSALRDLAQQHGIAYPVLYPLIIDGFVVVASLSVLRNSLNGQRTWYPWLLVATSTIVSIVFNIIHAEMELISQIVASIPPAALFFSFELLMQQVKTDVQKVDATLARKLASLQEQIKALQSDKSTLQTQLQEKVVVIGRKNKELLAKDSELQDILTAWQGMNQEHQILA